MKQQIENLIQKTLKNLDLEVKNFSVEHPADLAMGDYSTNVAMVSKTNPDIFKKELEKDLSKEFEKIEIKNGFINFYLSKDFFAESVGEILENKNFGGNDLLKGKKVMVEYTDPNPFKPFHIGHLMTNAIGESIARLCEKSGAKVVRANYQGDVGPHVAKAIYALMKDPLRFQHLPLNKGEEGGGEPVSVLAQFIGSCYVKGNEDYENDENSKKEIDEINKKIYEKSDKEINGIYDWGRKITLEAFEEIYKVLDTKFDKYYFESEVAPIGLKIVEKNIDKVFEKSDGAIIFKAEKYDPKLHTRVFVNSKGLPTYETKELGLTLTKFEKENPDLSIIITAMEQGEYMKVVQKSIGLVYPNLENRMKHITHGMMRFASGKMSSRKGNVVTGESLIEDAIQVVLEKMKDRKFTEGPARNAFSIADAGGGKKEVAAEVGVSALKYSILKQSIGGDIIYDFEKSISFEGDSGPYLQYSYARAKSILEKAGGKRSDLKSLKRSDLEEPIEIEKLLYRFPEIVLRSAKEFEPHYIANYLIELARAFNGFYGNTQIINKDDPASPYKVALTEAFSIIIKNGLYLLGIKAPERM